MRRYRDLLTEAIDNSGLKLSKLSELIGKRMDSPPSVHYLSRLKNGKTVPAADKLNDALAEVLEIDPIDLKAAAYREKIPPEVLERLGCEPSMSAKGAI